jgi:hypothetical protein
MLLRPVAYPPLFVGLVRASGFVPCGFHRNLYHTVLRAWNNDVLEPERVRRAARENQYY